MVPLSYQRAAIQRVVCGVNPARVDDGVVVIGPHGTGHLVARDGRLLRVDQAGAGRWVATRYTPGLAVHDVFYGNEQEVRAVVAQWCGRG